MKTILVTGAAGFIGSNLAEKLLLDGWKVINVDNFNDFYNPSIKRRNVEETQNFYQTNHLPPDCYHIVEGDICDSKFLETVFDQYNPEVVVHLAAYAGVRPSILNPRLYSDVNIGGLMNILENIKRCQIKRFVFASSSSVYGNNKKVPFSENDPVDLPISPYAATKKSGELIAHTYHHLFGINTACLRFFTVYGPRQRPDLAIHKFTRLILSGQEIPFYGDGSTKRDYTYIDDIVDGINRAIEWTDSSEKRYDIFNLGESNTISLSELVSSISVAIGKDAILNKMPMQPGDVLQTYADISKAKRILGYDPHTAFKTGYAKFLKWYLSSNKMEQG